MNLLREWPTLLNRLLTPAAALAKKIAGPNEVKAPAKPVLPPDRFDEIATRAATGVTKTLGDKELTEAHEIIRAHALRLAGEPGDIEQRVVFLHQIYEDSGGNHAFPLVALHGALWAHGYFALGDKAVDLLGLVLDRKELSEFSEAMKSANRSVFVDTYTNYYFSKHFGEQPGAAKLVDPKLLEGLNQAHRVNRAGRALAPEPRRELFGTALQVEQERTVTAAVNRAAADFDYDLLERIAFMPPIQFSYFPGSRALVFGQFASKDERISEAMKAYDLGAEAGFDKVEGEMRRYNVLPDAFFEDPAAYAKALERKLTA